MMTSHGTSNRFFLLLLTLLMLIPVSFPGVSVVSADGSPADAHEDHAEEGGEETSHDGHDAHDDEGGEHGEHEGVAEIPVQVQERFGIRTARAEPGPVEIVAELPGEIVPDPDRLVRVAPQFPGTVRKLLRHAGERVRQGDVLAVIESSESLAPYNVRAGISGVIVDENAPVGQVVDPGHVLFTIVDTDVVWVELRVFPRELGRVRAGQTVQVVLPGERHRVDGTIAFVTPVLDHETRAATARVTLKNDGHLYPGLFVTGRVTVGQRQAALTVPTSALVRAERGWQVFVREAPERFVARDVAVGMKGVARAEIIEGIEPGDEIVVEGAFLVRSAAAREAMGGGHSH